MNTSTNGYARPELLVEPDWLDDQLTNYPDVVVIACDRPQIRLTHGHIPGALHLPVHPYFRDQESNWGVAGPEETEKIMQTLGVNNDSRVILYDSEGGLLASRVWWVLWYYGFENAALLNGGWPAWVASRRPTTYEHRSVQPGNFTVSEAIPERIANCDVILDGLNSGDIVPLDVRADEEWTGEKPFPNASNKVEGRIPGAIHIEWRDFVAWDNATRFKPASEMNRILEAAGVPRDKKIVPY